MANLEKFNFNSLSPFKWFVLNNFPFIDADFDAMTEWQLFQKIGEWINKIIDSQNTVGTEMEKVVSAYIELYKYVDNYFKNLDVQDEINNKLNEMAESGELTELIKNYVDPIFNEFSDNINNEVDSINTKVNSLASGSPAGVYQTLEDLQQADPDHKKIYLVLSDNSWYYYSTNKWVRGGQYLASVMGKDSVTPYMEQSILKYNIVPTDNWIVNKSLESGSGTIIDYTGGCYNPDYISIEGNIYLASIVLKENPDLRNANLQIFQYNSSKTYIKNEDLAINNGHKGQILLDSNCAFIRFSSYEKAFASYPANYPAIIKTNDIPKMLDYTRNTYLNPIYNIIDNNNILINNDIMFYPLDNYNNTILEYLTILNLYKVHYYLESDVSVYNFIPIFIKKISIGDIIKVKITNKNKLDSVGLYKFDSGSEHINFEYDKDNDYYYLLINENVINTLFNGSYENIKTKLCPRYVTNNESFTIDTDIEITLNNNVNNFQDIVEAINDLYKKFDEQKFYKGLFLGDSITALTESFGWITYFTEIIPTESAINVAVPGAQLMDHENSIYNGNPSGDDPANNVLGNQVQKILNNDYPAPDYIIIAIGTNGGITFTSEEEIYNTYYDENGDVVPLENVDRKTSAGAFRYCNEKLHEKYPEAMICWCTPIQANTKMKRVNDTIKYGENLKVLCNYGANYCIDSIKCGILGINEIANENGEDLVDGLHPNEHGAKKLGTFNACIFKKFLDRLE